MLRQANVTQLSQLQHQCTLTEKDRDYLSTLTTKQATNITTLSQQVSFLEQNVTLLTASVTASDETLRQTRAAAEQQVGRDKYPVILHNSEFV